MSLNVPQYKITTDDLPDADRKTQRGIGPLLDALNRCLGAVTLLLNALTLPTIKAATFTTAANGAAYLTLGQLAVTPKDLWVTSLTPKSGTLDSVWSFSWVPATSGAVILFVGLEPLTTYAARVAYE